MNDPIREARAAAVSIAALFESGPVAVVKKARVTAVNVGPPKTVDVKTEDKFTIPRVRYLLSYATPTVNDAVYVIVYGDGKRFVLGEEA